MTKDPFELFDEGLEKLKAGDPDILERSKPIVEAFKKAFDGNSKGAVIKVGVDGVETQSMEEFKEDVIEKKEEKLKAAVKTENYEKAAEI